MLNENKGDEMIEILKHLHQYVPEVETEENVYISSEQTYVKKCVVHQHKLLFGGDQLTVARIRGAQTAMCNATDSHMKLEGFIPTIQDWHTQVVLVEVLMHYVIE